LHAAGRFEIEKKGERRRKCRREIERSSDPRPMREKRLRRVLRNSE